MALLSILFGVLIGYIILFFNHNIHGVLGFWGSIADFVEIMVMGEVKKLERDR